jgi:hypothetical protein
MEKELIVVCNEFNKSNIKYAVAFSFVLKHYGLTDKVNDIDIIIDPADLSAAKKIMERIAKPSNEIIISDQFDSYLIQYKISKIKIELMSDIKIKFGRGTYRMIFDEKSIQKRINIEGVTVPLLALEELYVMYLLLKGKEEKADRIETHFKQKGLKDKDLLMRAISQELPLTVVNRAYVLFNKKN